MEQINKDNQSCIIGGMNYSFTEQDCVTAAHNYFHTILSHKNKLSFVFAIVYFVLLVQMIALIIFLYPKNSEFSSSIMFLSVLTALILFLLIFRPVIRKKNITKTIENSVRDEEINLPIKLIFYEDRIERINSASYVILGFEEITRMCELKDGLYIIYQNGRFTYIPARFFNKDFAFQIMSFLHQKLGARYKRFAYMDVSDAAEYPGEPTSPMVEETEPRYEFDFVMKKKDVAAMTRGNSLLCSVITTVIFAVISAVCLSCHASYEILSCLLYLFGLIAGIAAVLLLLITFKSFSLNKFASKNMHMKFFDDHVTMITEKSVKKRNYAMIKSVERLKKFIRIILNNSTLLYVPESAAQSAEQFAEFEQFIKGFVQKKKS